MGGKRQSNILASVITNFETVEDVIETSMNSSGSAIAENEKWLDSIEGKTYQFTNALQTMWSNMIDSEMVKSFLDFGTDAIQFLDTGAGKVIALVAALKLMAKFKGFSLGGIVQGLGDTINKITTAQNALQILSKTTKIGQGYDFANVNAYAQAVANLTAKQQANLLASQGLNKEQIRYALTLNQVDDAAMREAMAHVHATTAKQQENAVTAQSIQQKAQELAMSYRTQAATADETRAKELNVVADILENATSEEAIENNLQEAITSKGVSASLVAETTSTLGLTTAKTGLLAVTKALMAANPIGFWITVGSTILSLIPIVSDLVGAFTKSADEIKQEATEISQAYSDAVSEINSNLDSLGITFDTKSISTLENEFSTLAAGVDRYGNNISLTSDEYERYREICEQIVGINPSIAKGYDSATEAIGNNAGVLTQLIELQKEQMRLAAEEYISDENLKTLSKDAVNDFNDAIKEVGNVNTNLRGNLSSFFGNIVGNQDLDGDMHVLDDQMQYVLEKLGYDAAEIQQKIDSYWDYSVNDFNIGKFWLDYSDDVQNNINKFGAEYYSDLSKIFDNADSEFAAAEAKLKKAQDGLIDTLLVAPVSSKDYDKLTSEGKNFLVDWIKNSEQFKVDGDLDEENVKKMKETVLDMMDLIVSESKNIEYNGEKFTAQEILSKIYDLDSSVDFSTYKEQLKALLQSFWNSLSDAQKEDYGFKDFEDFQISLGFNFVADEEAESEMIKGYARAKNISEDEARKYFDSLPAIVVQRLLQVDWNLVDKDNVDETIKNAENESFNVTSYKTYSVLAESVESYNDILSQTSEIVSDNTEVTQEYKDSLTDLGLSEEELADCFDDNNKLIVKNAALLNKLVKQKKQDKKATVQQAKAYGQLQYKTTINQIGQLVNKMAAEVKATGYVSSATLKNINILRQQLTTIKETIQQYALLELSLSNAAQAYDDFAAAKERDAKLIYGDAMVDALNVLNEGFKTGQVGSEAFQYAVKLIVPPEVYENIDDIQKRMDAIHDYVDSNPIFADWFTIDEGQISITMDNIKAFIQDGLNGVDGREPVFIGTLEDFDLSNSINSIEEFAAALGTTEAVALAMLTEFEKYDASWGNIVDRLTTSPLDRAINDTTTALEEAINAQEKFIRDGNQLYDEHGNNTAEYQEKVDGVTKAYENLGEATKAAVDNATTFTQIETLLQGLTGRLQLAEGQADELARSLGLIGEGQSITLETGEIKLTQDQVDILNEKLTGLTKPTTLDLQLASDTINEQIQELQNKLEGKEYNSDVLVGIDVEGEEKIQEKINELTETQRAIELVYNITPSGNQNDSNLEKLGEWETNGVTIVVRADSTECSAEMDAINARKMDDKEVHMTTNAPETNAEIDTVTDNNPPDKTVNLAMQGISTAINEINSIGDALAGLSGTTYHTVVVQYDNQNSGAVSADGNFHISGGAFAGGTVGAPKTETSLVGELGPELIVDPSTGRWHTVGDHGAEFTQVKKGQIIFNHLQTKQLLENGYVTSRGRLQGGGHAFASGTAYGYGTYDKYTGKDDAFKNGSNNSASSSKSNENSSNDTSDNIADKVEEVVDFIEMKLEEIEKKIEKTSNKIVNLLDDTTSVKKKDKYYDALVKGEKDKASTYSKAAQKYNVEAEAALSGVPKKYQAMARNGAIAIKDFIGEDQVEVAEAIQKYRDWKAKADEAENKYLESIAAIAAYRVEQLEDISSDFENIISIYKSHSDLLQSQMDLVEESGNRLSANYYEELKKNSQSQLDNLKNQRAAMQKVLDDAVASGDIAVGSDEWYTMVNAITEVDKKIVDCKTDIEKYQNAINDLHWQNFDKFIDEIENVESELSNLYSLISDADKIVDDKGNWTNEGITSLGLLAQQMETAQFKAQQYGEAIDKLKQDYAKGLYSTDEYNKKLAELTEGQHDAIKSYEDAKDAIVNLNKTRAEAAKKYMQDEIDKYGELIEKKKESLNTDKEARGFEKSVQESNKNIKDIERQIAALQGNTSSSAIAQRKRLEAELLKAREELQDKYYDHSINKQQEALDKELEDYTKNKKEQMDALDEYLKKEEQVISDSFNLVAKNAKVVADTLTKISAEYGVSISSTIANPWINGTNAIGKYEEQLNTSVSATTKNLDTIKKHLENLQAQADKTAKSIIKATQTTVSKTTGGKQTSTKGYAKGSKSVEYDQWAIIDELGEELQIVPGENGRLEYIKKGTGILNSTLTERLMNLAMDPTSMIENSRPIIGAHGMTTNNNAIQIDNSVGTLLHVEHLDGSNPAEVAKLVDKAWEKKMQTLNNSIKKFTR